MESNLQACVLPLDKSMSQSQFMEFLCSFKIKFTAARKKPEWGYAFVHFSTKEDRAHAAEVITKQLTLDGRSMCLRDATSSKPVRKQDLRPVRPSDIRDVVSPLWRMPYGQQLFEKYKRISSTLSQIRKQVFRHCGQQGKRSQVPLWIDPSQGYGAHLCCPLLGILRSPQVSNYRNKSEFTIGPGEDGEAVVGFCLGAYKQGITTISPPDLCCHISPLAVRFAAHLQAFLRSHSRLPVWEKRRNSGFWRLLTVREGRKETFLPIPGGVEEAGLPTTAHSFADLDWERWCLRLPPNPTEEDVPVVDERCPPAPLPDQVMLVLQIDPNAAERDAVDAELASLSAYLQKCAAEEGLPLTSLMLQLHSGISNAAPLDAELQPFPGAPVCSSNPRGCIRDTLAGLSFDISPAAFFQVNSGAAAVMYKLVGEWAGADADSLVLDICCGTGTIAISVSGQVARVVGVEILEQAVEDARHNAAANGVTNAEFIAGKAEDVIQKLLSREGLVGVLQAGQAVQSGRTATPPVAAAAPSSCSPAGEPDQAAVTRAGPLECGSEVEHPTPTWKRPRLAETSSDAAAGVLERGACGKPGLDVAFAGEPDEGMPDAAGVCPDLAAEPEEAMSKAVGNEPDAGALPDEAMPAGGRLSSGGAPPSGTGEADVACPAEARLCDQAALSGDAACSAEEGMPDQVTLSASGGPPGEAAGAQPPDAESPQRDMDSVGGACLGKRKRGGTEGNPEGREPSEGPEGVRKTDMDDGGSGPGIAGPERDPGLPKRLVAIVDPPRAGLHPKVLMALLQCSALKRVVYVSCNPDTLLSNVVTLCTPCPNKAHEAFVPVRAMAVDLFPHTNHCEAVLLLER
eukprot:jgi/Botrbrau1/8699/Bobra.0311s0014.1